MKRVLITGVGGGVGQSVLKSFQGSTYETIGTDASPLATGLYTATRGYLVPMSNDPIYIDHIIDLCRKEDVRILFPGMEEDVKSFAANTDRMRAAGLIPVVSSPMVVAIADDKLKTARFLEENAFPFPVTHRLSDDASSAMPLPLILKPMLGGARSKGVYKVTTREQFERLRAQLDPFAYVAQEYIEGDEYTCGTVNFDGRCHGAILMRRDLRDGDTYRAFVVNDPALESHVRKLAEALQPFGPCNFQIRIRDGVPYLFEINARCSGTTGCRSLAGFNEPIMTANYLLENIPPHYEIRPISILRYWKELVVENDQIAWTREHRATKGSVGEL